MTTERDLLDDVTALLTGGGVPHTLIGASALSRYGVSRSTLDIDLLVTNSRVLERDFWSPMRTGVRVDIRQGDASDPLAGVVRLQASDQRDVDVVVGRHLWQAEAIARAQSMVSGPGTLAVARPSDLILLKLYAGGHQDRWDIEQLLAAVDRAGVTAEVDASVGRLPPGARELWATLRG